MCRDGYSMSLTPVLALIYSTTVSEVLVASDMESGMLKSSLIEGFSFYSVF